MLRVDSKLTDDQWQKILPILKICPQIRLGAGRDVCRFLEAVLLGEAMLHRLGMIIGKALAPLSDGVGEILVLLSLQLKSSLP